MTTPSVAPLNRPLRRDAEENRARILEAARALFAEHGLEVTLEAIARHAGVGIGTFYRRFHNREELLDELFEESLVRLEAIYRGALACEDAWDGCVAFLERSFEMMAEDRGLWALAIRGASKTRHLASGRELFWTYVPALLRRAQDAGALRADLEPADLSVLHTALSAALRFCGSQAPGAARRLLVVFLDGLRARPGASALSAPAMGPAELDQALDSWYSPSM